MKSVIYILFRNDDPGALSNPEKEKMVLELFAKYNAPQVLAVIPNNVDDPHVWHKGGFHALEKNPEIIQVLKAYTQKGLVEIAQHGFTHQTNRFRPSVADELTEEKFYQGIDRKWTAYQPAHSEGYSEFSGLSLEEQREKIVKGQEYLEQVFSQKLKSFIFPWNTYDRNSLKALNERGFQFVPCEEDEMIMPGLCLIGACNWDWEIERFDEMIQKAEELKKPVLTQFAYHSWEISEEMMKKIDGLLRKLSAKENIKFVLPSQVPAQIPWAPRIIALRCLMLRLERKLNPYLRCAIYSPRYYIHDDGYYAKRIIKLFVSLLFLKYLGLKKTLAASVLGSVALFLWAFRGNQFNAPGWVDISLFLAVAVFIFAYLRIKNRVQFRV